MGLFDSLKHAGKKAAEGAAPAGTAPVATGAGTGGGSITAGSAEESAVSSLLGEGGSQLPALLDKLGAGGLGDTAASWVSKGSNLPVSADQIKTVLESDQVAAVAAKLGISEDAAAAKIADVLPGIIDKVTPDGVVPDPDALAANLTGLIKKQF
jgi:uncharacterized protein YidB (DUF937 family)